MLDIRAAVANAMEFAKNSLGRERTATLRLEELESSVVNDTPVWLITLSTALGDDSLPATPPNNVPALGAAPAREYKIFTVSKINGEVLSMKIRLLAIPATAS